LQVAAAVQWAAAKLLLLPTLACMLLDLSLFCPFLFLSYSKLIFLKKQLKE
jgi:hypothetical protein